MKTDFPRVPFTRNGKLFTDILTILRIASLILLLTLACSWPAVAADVGELRYLGRQVVPTGTEVFGTTVGGLSGIDYDPGSDTYQGAEPPGEIQTPFPLR